MNIKLTVALSTLALCASAVAGPAAYYKWRSKLDGNEVCRQTMAGDWVKISGPYKDSRCTQPGVLGAAQADPGEAQAVSATCVSIISANTTATGIRFTFQNNCDDCKIATAQHVYISPQGQRVEDYFDVRVEGHGRVVVDKPLAATTQVVDERACR